MELPVVNHLDYEAKIKDDNKFPIKKFGELAKYLLENKVVKKFYNPKFFHYLKRSNIEYLLYFFYEKGYKFPLVINLNLYLLYFYLWNQTLQKTIKT